MIIQSLEHELGPEVTEAFIERILCRIPQYQEQCRFIVSHVNPDEVIPLARFAVASRLQVADGLARQYIDDGVSPFEIAICMHGNTVRLLFPPVVESLQNGMYLMDGIHRFLVARTFCMKHIRCVLIKGEHIPLRSHDLKVPFGSLLKAPFNKQASPRLGVCPSNS